MARTTADKRRFLYPHATHEKRNSVRVWLNHKRRFAMEQKERESIANAFESYSNWYGSQNAEEVKQLAGGNPSDFSKKPKWPSYIERTMKGPLKEDPIEADIKHETGLRPSSLQRCESPPESEHESVSLPKGSNRCSYSESGGSNHENVSLLSSSNRCDLSSPGAPSQGDLQAVDEQVTAVQGSLDNIASSDISMQASGEAAAVASHARAHDLTHVELLHAWAENAEESQKSYNSSKFEKKGKSRGNYKDRKRNRSQNFPGRRKRDPSPKSK